MLIHAYFSFLSICQSLGEASRTQSIRSSAQKIFFEEPSKYQSKYNAMEQTRVMLFLSFIITWTKPKSVKKNHFFHLSKLSHLNKSIGKVVIKGEFEHLD